MSTLNIEYRLIDILLTVGVAQGLFLTIILLLIKKGNVKANRFLGLFILFFSLLTIGDILYETRLLILFPHFLLVFDPLLFVLAPFGYLYVKNLTHKNWKFKLQHLLHFTPAISLYFLFLSVYFYDAKTKEKLILESYSVTDNSTELLLVLAAIQIFIYLLINLKLIRENAKNIKNYYSYQESVNLTWLTNFLIINFILWFAYLLSTFYHFQVMTDISNLLFTVTVYSIGYFGIRQPDIFFYEEVAPDKDLPKISSKKKYASSTLTGKLAQKYVLDLVDLMKKEKIYLINDLKLIDLAEKLHVPAHHISQVINENLKKNFNDFVNEFRVEEFKKRLLDHKYQELKILAIGLDCGFNSKAAMNLVFKEHSGMSPSAFRKQHLSG